ncbi:MAG: hypothetical protein ACRCTA_07090 [Bacilli bacterium]
MITVSFFMISNFLNNSNKNVLESNYGVFLNKGGELDYPVLNISRKIYVGDLLREFNQGNATPINQVTQPKVDKYSFLPFKDDINLVITRFEDYPSKISIKLSSVSSDLTSFGWDDTWSSEDDYKIYNITSQLLQLYSISDKVSINIEMTWINEQGIAKIEYISFILKK